MEFTISQQMQTLLYSVVCGLMLGAVYDVFRAIRVIVGHRHKVAIFALDVIYMLVFTFVSVFYSMSVTRGNTRYFIILGELFGFFAVRLTVGRVSIVFFERIFSAFRKIIKIVIEKLVKTAKKLLQDIHSILYNMNEKRRYRHKTCRACNKSHNKRGNYENESKAC